MVVLRGAKPRARGLTCSDIVQITQLTLLPDVYLPNNIGVASRRKQSEAFSCAVDYRRLNQVCHRSCHVSMLGRAN
jgi:hypothetical protein